MRMAGVSDMHRYATGMGSHCGRYFQDLLKSG